MHMADALLSPPVAAVMYAATAAAAGASLSRLKKEARLSPETSRRQLPFMAIMSALVFAGQMVNFAIPGTGSSGHLCGGLLLAALLGPAAGFLSMIAVLTVQCLLFADGGLLALGANIWNMAFYGCFVGYYLIFRPLAGKTPTKARLTLASILGAVIALQLGAFSVVVETGLSGITELPFGPFCGLMLPIHLVIGLVEGLITAAVLCFIHDARPELLTASQLAPRRSWRATLVILAAVTLAVGGGLSLLASEQPDGLEWSLFGNQEEGYGANMGLDEEAYGVDSAAAQTAAQVQSRTSLLPDYAFAGAPDDPRGTAASGLLGAALVAAVAVLICLAGRARRRRRRPGQQRRPEQQRLQGQRLQGQPPETEVGP